MLLAGRLVAADKGTRRAKTSFAGRGRQVYSLGGFLLTFIALSCSQYKLPHYIFVTLPWAAVLVARWLHRPFSIVARRRWTIGQYFVLFVLVVAAFLMAGFVFATRNPLIWIPMLGIFGWLSETRIFKNPFPGNFADALVQRSVLALIGAGFVLKLSTPIYRLFRAPRRRHIG